MSVAGSRERRRKDDVIEVLRCAGYVIGLRFGKVVGLFQESAYEWQSDNAQRLGAALAFYTLLSLAPILVVIVAVAALAFGRQAVSGQLFWQIQDFTGSEPAKVVQGLVQAAYKPGTGLVATSLSILTLMFGASSVVVELIEDLNIIWHCPVTANSTGWPGIVSLAKERFYSFVLVFGAGILLAALVALSAGIAALGRTLDLGLSVPETLLHVAAFLFSFFVGTFLFAAIYKTLPAIELQWSDVLVGASVTSFVFAVGKQLIGLYLGKASFASTYGAAGSLVVLLVWVYYSAQLFFLGAEFTKVYAQTFGSFVAHRDRRQS